MSIYLQRLFPSTAIPTLLLGLSAFALKDLLPDSLELLIGRAALVLLLTSAVVYLLLRAYHKVIPRRFANEVYLLDDAMNVALIEHPFHRRIQPPGTRLGYYEAPHEAVRRVLKEELGIASQPWYFLPAGEREIGKVKIVPAPVQVQVEHRKQRLGVAEHYDFVYLCRVPGIRPMLQSPLSPRWLSLAELQEIARSNVEIAPFEDVIPSLERLIGLAQSTPIPPGMPLEPRRVLAPS